MNGRRPTGEHPRGRCATWLGSEPSSPGTGRPQPRTSQPPYSPPSIARVVYVYRSQHDVHVIGDDRELTVGEVLPGFRCLVGRLFP